MARPRSAARIRSLKPELWESRDFIAQSAHGQLVFLALVSRADDEGRQETDAWHLSMTAVRGLAEEDIARALADLSRARMIRCYTAEGRPWIAVERYTDDACPWGQRIDRPSPSQCPPPPADGQVEAEFESSGVDYSRLIARNRDLSHPTRARWTGPDRTGPDWTGPVATPRAAAHDPAPEQAREDSHRAAAVGTPVADVENPPVVSLPLEIAARADRLRAGCESVIARALRQPERDLVLGWATDLRRGDELVPEAEILAVVRRQMTAPTKNGTPPANLRWCEDDVGALARERAPTGGERPRVLSEAEAVDARLAERQRQLREGGA